MNKFDSSKYVRVAGLLLLGFLLGACSSGTTHYDGKALLCAKNSVKICSSHGSDMSCACRKRRYFDPNSLLGPSWN